MRMLFACCLLALCAGCHTEGRQPEVLTGGEDCEVTVLFTVDGIKVYRFYDGCHHYFAVDDDGDISMLQDSYPRE